MQGWRSAIFLRHLKKELSIGFVRLAQQSAKLVEVTHLFTNAAPCDVIRRFSLGEVRQFRSLLAFVKQLIERALTVGGTPDVYRDLQTWLDQPFQAPPALAGLHDGQLAMPILLAL